MIVPTYATTMCVANDTVAVVLNPNLPIKGSGSNVTTGTWWVWSDAWTLYGISACLNSGKGLGQEEAFVHLYDINDEGKDKFVVGSEKYGSYCWCRLIHPLSSNWVFHYNYGRQSMCAQHCAGSCAERSRDTLKLREALFNSISN